MVRQCWRRWARDRIGRMAQSLVDCPCSKLQQAPALHLGARRPTATPLLVAEQEGRIVANTGEAAITISAAGDSLLQSIAAAGSDGQFAPVVTGKADLF